MGWICKYCSTNNDDGATRCFVCDNARSYSYTRTLTPVRVLELGLKGDVVVPEEYNVIGIGAFQNRTDITSVTIHSGVRKILKEAFAGCVNLRDVNNKAELSSIGARAFYNCRSLPVGKRPTARYVHEEAFIGASSYVSTSSSSSYSSTTTSRPVTYTYASTPSVRSSESSGTSSTRPAPAERRETAPVRITTDTTRRSDTTSVRGDSDSGKGRVFKWFARFLIAGAAIAALVAIVVTFIKAF